MRLGYDAKRLFRNFTGLGNYSRTTVRNLAENYPQHEYQLYTPGLERTSVTAPFLESDLYDVHQAPAGIPGSYWRSYGVVGDLVRNGVQLYHGLSHELPLGLDRAGISSVVTIHDLIFRTHPQLYPLVDRTIYDLKFRYACRVADRVVAISEETKRQITEHYGTEPERIDVVYQSCDPLYYDDRLVDIGPLRKQYGLPADYLLFVGSITRRKNLEVILEAFTRLPAELRLPLAIVGRGSRHRAELERHPGYAAAAPLLYWIEDCDNLQLKTLYTHARALLYPSLAEGFGLPVVEALLCRTPVITSGRSSLPEAGGPGSLYVDPTDADALADALTRLLEDGGLADRMRTTGYQYALANFGPRATADALMSVYQKILTS